MQFISGFKFVTDWKYNVMYTEGGGINKGILLIQDRQDLFAITSSVNQFCIVF